MEKQKESINVCYSLKNPNLKIGICDFHPLGLVARHMRYKYVLYFMLDFHALQI